ncbi:MAG: 4Fe-4S binding protein [Desulfomonile tiedjei]|nr:4Fe-4S binding protein [Desulfomonile tiedjei]
MRFQRITQTVTLILFLGLFLLAASPFPDGLGVDLFLRLDPLVDLGTVVAARDFQVFLLPGFILLASAFLFGRVFCGHICPMGTTLDVLERTAKTSRKSPTKTNSREAAGDYRAWKYLCLLVILAGAAGGVSLVFVGSPLSLVTRFYALVVHPVALALLDAALALVSPLASHTRFAELAHVQVDQRVFATGAFVAAFFVAMTALAYVQPRFWCRNLCPTGALFGLCSRSPRVRRKVNDSCTGCGRCIRGCPTAAISEDPTQTDHAECIVCLRCVSVCPEAAVSFGTIRGAAAKPAAKIDLSRRRLFLAMGSGLATAGLIRTGIHQPVPKIRDRPLRDGELIRPPGALPEAAFLERCIRCGECMKACPTNTLQPIWLKAGLEGIFSPIMLPRLGPCAVGCNVCGQVCPTGAIRNLPLIEKRHAKVGTAWIARETCLVWEQDKKCLVCDEVCPYGAVAFRPVEGKMNAVPFVTGTKCTGCGWCECKCPVEGTSAIRVGIAGEIRLNRGSYVEKSREYGFVFKIKETGPGGLAPGTFDAPDSAPAEGPGRQGSPASGTGLPPGIILK